MLNTGIDDTYFLNLLSTCAEDGDIGADIVVQGASAKQVAAYVPVCEPFSSGMHLNRRPVGLVAQNGPSVFFCFLLTDISRQETLK